MAYATSSTKVNPQWSTDDVIFPPANFDTITPSANFLDPPARVLVLSAADTVTVVTMGGQTVSIPMQAGYNVGQFAKVTAATATVVGGW